MCCCLSRGTWCEKQAGTPGEDIRDVVDSVIFASSRIGSVIPMLFTCYLEVDKLPFVYKI